MPRRQEQTADDIMAELGIDYDGNPTGSFEPLRRSETFEPDLRDLGLYRDPIGEGCSRVRRIEV
jgi:hypothetical protein